MRAPKNQDATQPKVGLTGENCDGGRIARGDLHCTAEVSGTPTMRGVLMGPTGAKGGGIVEGVDGADSTVSSACLPVSFFPASASFC